MGVFENNFGITKTLEQAKAEFVNKIENIIFNNYPSPDSYPNFEYCDILEYVCTRLGLRFKDYKAVFNKYLPLETISSDDFLKTLELTVHLYKGYAYYTPGFEKRFDIIIPAFIDAALPRLGIRWANGMFYPDPIPEIDAPLIDENLRWLNDYPAAKKNIQTALQNYGNNSNTDILENCYEALENVAQVLCKSNKALHREDFKNEIISKLEVSQKWKLFLDNFINYSNDLRHGKDPNRHIADSDEVESYMFLSLIMIRMILKKVNRS